MATTLPDLAAAINAEHAAALEHAHSAVRRAHRAGELLLQAKQQCAHGQWLPWLKEHCPDISRRSAQAYMRLARHFLNSPESAGTLENLTLREALTQLSEKRNGRVFGDSGESFLETCLRHLDESAALEWRCSALSSELDGICAELDDPESLGPERLQAHLQRLAAIANSEELHAGAGTLQLRMQRHLGRAFNDGLSLADAMGAEPQAVAAALGVDAAITLEEWLLQGATIREASAA